MKPNDLKARRAATGRARVRLAIKAHLAWLHGYPLESVTGGVRWRTLADVPDGEAFVVDRARIRRAVAALTKLTRRERRALAAAVDDPALWEVEQRERIAALQTLVHGRRTLAELAAADLAALPPSLTREVSALARGPLRDVVHASSWCLRGAPLAERTRALRTLVYDADALGRARERGSLDRTAALRWIEWASREPRGPWRDLLAFLARLDPRAVPTANLGPFLQRVVQAAQERDGAAHEDPQRPSSTLPEQLARWWNRLATLDPRARRRAVQLLLAAVPHDLGERWEAFWSALDAQRTRLAGRRRSQPGRRAARTRRERAAELAPLRAALAARPPELPPWLLDRTLELAVHRGQAEPTRRLLERLPPYRARWLTSEALLEPPPVWMTLGDARADLEARERWRWFRGPGDPATRLAFWSASRHLPQALLRVADPAERRACTAALERAFRDGEHAALWRISGALDALVAHAEASADAAWAHAATLAILRARGEAPWTMRSEIRARRALAGSDPQLYARIALSLLDHGDPDEDLWTDEDPHLVQRLGKRPLVARAAQWFAEGRHRELRRTELQLRALAAAGATDVPAPRVPRRSLRRGTAPWIESCPAALRDDLARFASVDDDAEGKVRKLLGVAFRDVDAWRRELEALEARQRREPGTPSAHRAKRIASLRERLRRPPEPSAARLARWSATLRERAWETSLEQWRLAVERRFLDLLGERAGLAPLPAFCREERHASVLAAFFLLESRTRRLAFHLLGVRAGEKPWDLRDHPANRAFFAGVRRRGLVVEPWLDGIPAQTWTTADGREVQLALEDDPLEVFHMGRHFRTCLSPAGCNFASVVANAADANKRVVYARDRRGAVLGRCLIALTREGHLVTFHPYAHEERHDFEVHLAAFVRRLAHACGTEVVRDGAVPTLVAHDWYDDGSRDLTRRFPALEEGSAFRAALAALDGPAFRARVRRELELEATAPIVLPLLLDLPELRANPALLGDLFPALLAEPHLPPGTLLRAAADLLDHGRPAEARTLLARAGRQRALSRTAALELARGWLRAEEPSRALEVLRRTRPSGVRAFADEDDFERLQLAVDAHAALGRRGAALSILDRALAQAVLPRVHRAALQDRRNELASA